MMFPDEQKREGEGRGGKERGRGRERGREEGRDNLQEKAIMKGESTKKCSSAS